MTKEASRSTHRPPRQALTAFGVEPADLRFVNLSENVTFRAIDARDGSPLVLRLHRPWYHDIAALRSEHLWTRALVQAGIAAPEPLQTQAGENFAQVEFAATGERRWAGLARWVEGELLADVVARETDTAVNARHFARMGAIMAAMHDQATAWTPPAGFQRHALDADGLMGRNRSGGRSGTMPTAWHAGPAHAALTRWQAAPRSQPDPCAPGTAQRVDRRARPRLSTLTIRGLVAPVRSRSGADCVSGPPS